MTYLRHKPVNPLNSPQFATTEGLESSANDFASANEVLATLGTLAAPAPSLEPPDRPIDHAQANHQLVLPTPYQRSGGDGFDELQAGFGAFPSVKLDAGQFRIENESIGKEFQANILSIKKLFIWQIGEAGHHQNRPFVRSYDNLITTCGRRLRDVLLGWRAEGYYPKQREITEALAEIQSGVWQGQLVTLSIPPRSASRLAAYAEVLQRRHRLRIPEVITRIHVGEWVSTKTGGFHHWTFDFQQEVPRQ